MKTAASVFGKPSRRVIPFSKVEWPLPEQLIGIEIELETFPGVRHPTNLVPYWTKVRDGSLRNGMEYVLAQPLKGDSLSRAIYELFHDAVMVRSTTGSTHVHIDMMEEDTSPDTIKTLVMLAYVLEPAVFAIADPGREWCGYTNKLTSAPDALIGSVMSAQEDNGYRELLSLCHDHHRVGRYYGLNLLALQEHGSIEFRYFPTATSVDDVIEWVTLVQCFKKAALAVGTVAEVLNIFGNAERYETFVANYFGRWKDQFLANVSATEAAHSVQKAMAVAGSFAHQQTNAVVWDERAVLTNKLYSKFMKSTKRLAGRIHFAVGADNVPENDARAGDLLLYRGVVYFRAVDRWHDLLHSLDPLLPYSSERRLACAAVKANASTIVAQLQERVETTTNINRIASRFNDVLAILAAQGDE